MNPLITSCCGTDNKIEHDKPDIEVLDKIEGQMPDVDCPFDIPGKHK